MDELIKELKEQGVLKSPLIEAAFRAVDRKDFVLPGEASEAYGNYPLAIGFGQTISQPYTVAFMLDLLDPRPGDKILDIGSGSGWQTALLAHIVGEQGGVKSSEPGPSSVEGLKVKSSSRVLAVERIPALCESAKRNIEKYNFIKKRAVEFVCGDAAEGLAKQAPFDKIIAAAAAEGKIPDSWRKQTKIGGRIVAPVDSSIWLYIKKSANEWEEKEYPGFAFVPLLRDHRGKSRQREQRSEKRLPTLFTAFLVLAAIFLLPAYAVFMPLKLPSPIEIEISAGSGSRMIGRELKVGGLIRSKWAFVAFATLSGRAGRLKPGRYQFEGRTTIPEIVRQVAEGERYSNERFVTIPEGWDVRDMGEYFEKAGLFNREEWWDAVGYPARDYRKENGSLLPKDFSEEFSFLADKPKNVGLEGFLFPDTYRVFRQATAEDVARKMLADFDRKLTPELRAEIAEQKKSIFEVITVASLLEKEIPNHDERKIASGILWKRLRLGMALQVDATINYITAKKETPGSTDLAVNSPYNTYRYAGLPIGPISNPGKEAILAATFPQESDYLYYLSTRDGQTVFSRTLAEHNIAKAKYLK